MFESHSSKQSLTAVGYCLSAFRYPPTVVSHRLSAIGCRLNMTQCMISPLPPPFLEVPCSKCISPLHFPWLSCSPLPSPLGGSVSCVRVLQWNVPHPLAVTPHVYPLSFASSLSAHCPLPLGTPSPPDVRYAPPSSTPLERRTQKAGHMCTRVGWHGHPPSAPAIFKGMWVFCIFERPPLCGSWAQAVGEVTQQNAPQWAPRGQKDRLGRTMRASAGVGQMKQQDKGPGIQRPSLKTFLLLC